MSDKSPLVINIYIKSEDRKCQIIESTVTSILFQVTDTTTRYVYKIHMRGMRNQSETTEGGLKNLDLKKECDLLVKNRTETEQAFALNEKHRGNIMLVEFFKYEGVPVLCATCVLIVKPSVLKIAQVIFKDSTGKEIGCGSVQYEADLKFSLRIKYNRPLLRGEKAPKLKCKGYCTNATTGKYEEISKFRLDENATYTDTLYCNEGLQESHAGANYVISLGFTNPYEPPFYVENTDILALSVQKIHLKSRTVRKPQIMSVVWSSKEMIKFGENSPKRKSICYNEDGFLHIHTREMYGQKVRIELFEKDTIGTTKLLLGLKDEVTILDNVVCVPVEMSGVHAKAKKGRTAWLEGSYFEIMARVIPLDTSIAVFEQDDKSLIELKIDKSQDEDKAVKSTVNGTMKFVIANVEEDEKKEKDKEKKEDMITYHIYAKGHKKQYTIEKHIPKVNKLPEKYKYVYHTADDKEHEICTRTWIEVPEMRTSDKLSNVPSGYDTEKTYTYPSNEGIDADKAYYYYNKDGELDYIVVEPKKSKNGNYKGKIRKYTANKSINKKILNILEEGGDNLSYNKDGVTISFTLKLTQTARIYCGVDQFAVLIGVMAEIGINYGSAGCTSKDATGYPSVTHVNGYSFDFSYKGNSNDQILVDVMQKWASNTTINVGFGANTGKHCSGTKVKPISGHDSHIHWGPNKNPIITIINMK